MSTQKISASWLLRSVLIIAVILLAAVAVHLLRKHREMNLRQLEDRSVAAHILGTGDGEVQIERIDIDDYRGYYGVYFACKADAVRLTDMLKRVGFRDYSVDSQERHDLVLHARNYKYLKKLNWGPITKFSHCPQYVGVWEKEYLVYLAVCDDQIYGYFENNYNVPSGPGPFQ